MISVRPARPDDVPIMSRVLIASITELCTPDHANDPQAIVAWTANKSEAGLRQMMATAALYVAEREEKIVAVGAIADDTVTLNYVDPAHRRTGASRALLHALEAALRQRGVTVARLNSTATAHAFYLSQGWLDDASIPPGRFITDFPMHKALLASAAPPAK